MSLSESRSQSPPGIRAFAAIELAAGPISEIQKLQHRLQAATGRVGVRWTRAEQIHLTLQFFGNVVQSRVGELISALEHACRGVRPFGLSISGLGCFPSLGRPQVVWVGVHGDLENLRRLQKNVQTETSQFGDHAEEREFHPHLTIGRVKAPPAEVRRVGELIRQSQTPPLGEWEVGEIELIQSKLTPQGSVYSRLTVVKLGAS